MKRFLIIAFITLLFPTVVSATDYYVRPSTACAINGDGTLYACNTGAPGSPGAWNSFSNVNWSTVDSGNGKLFVAGTHRETLTVGANGESGTPIQIVSCTIANGCGTDDSGTIKASDVTTGWSGPDGNGEYYKSIGTTPQQVFRDGTRLVEGSVGSLTADQWDESGGVTYLGFDPSGYTVEVGQRDICVNIANYDYITLDGITVSHANGWYDDGYSAIYVENAADNVMIKNVIAEYNYVYGIRAVTNIAASMTNLTIESSTTRYNGGPGIYISGGSGGNITSWVVTKNTSHDDCQLYDEDMVNPGSWDRDHAWCAGIKPAGSGLRTGEVSYNVCYNMSNAASSYSTYGNQACIYLDTSEAGYVTTIKYNKIYDSDVSCIMAERAKNDEIYGNVMYRCAQATQTNYMAGIHIYRDCIALKIYHNSIYDTNNTRSGIYIRGTDGYASADHIVKNNIIDNSQSWEYRTGSSDTSNVTADNNCLGAEKSGLANIYGTAYDTYDTLNGDACCTANFGPDPLYNDPSSGDLTLQSGSPCINTAEALGSPYYNLIHPSSTWPDNVTLVSGADEVGAFAYIFTPSNEYANDDVKAHLNNLKNNESSSKYAIGMMVNQSYDALNTNWTETVEQMNTDTGYYPAFVQFQYRHDDDTDGTYTNINNKILTAWNNNIYTTLTTRWCNPFVNADPNDDNPDCDQDGLYVDIPAGSSLDGLYTHPGNGNVNPASYGTAAQAYGCYRDALVEAAKGIRDLLDNGVNIIGWVYLVPEQEGGHFWPADDDDTNTIGDGDQGALDSDGTTSAHYQAAVQYEHNFFEDSHWYNMSAESGTFNTFETVTMYTNSNCTDGATGATGVYNEDDGSEVYIQLLAGTVSANDYICGDNSGAYVKVSSLAQKGLPNMFFQVTSQPYMGDTYYTLGTGEQLNTSIYHNLNGLADYVDIAGISHSPTSSFTDFDCDNTDRYLEEDQTDPTWTLASGQTFTYRSRVGCPEEINIDSVICKDGNDCDEKTSIADVEADADGAFYCDLSTGYLYLRTPDDDDPDDDDPITAEYREGIYMAWDYVGAALGAANVIRMYGDVNNIPIAYDSDASGFLDVIDSLYDEASLIFFWRGCLSPGDRVGPRLTTGCWADASALVNDSRTLHADNNIPVTSTPTSPADGADDQSVTPALTIQDYYGPRAHTYTWWQVASTETNCAGADWVNDLVYNSQSTSHLLSKATWPTNLKYSDAGDYPAGGYCWRTKFGITVNGSPVYAAAWSTVRQFDTEEGGGPVTSTSIEITGSTDASGIVITGSTDTSGIAITLENP